MHVDKNRIEKEIRADKIITPCYVIDKKVLKNHIQKIKEITDGTFGLCYAMKANPFLVKIISDEIENVEVCSSGELEICIKYGVSGDKIIYSGVNKTKKDIQEAIEYDVACITIESIRQIDLLMECCEKYNRSQNVMVRLSSGNQFGVSIEEFKWILANQKKYCKLNICGIHYFSGTQKRGVEVIIKEIAYIGEVIDELSREYGFNPDVFEYGLGLGVPYFQSDKSSNVYDDLTNVASIMHDNKYEYKITFEMGRFFVFSCAVYLTTINDIKYRDENNICIVDGGIHQVNYYGQNMGMRVPNIEIIKKNGNSKKDTTEWMICGSLCTNADVLVRKVDLGDLCVGDVLIFVNAGAYSITEAPLMFLSRKLPDIYMFSDESIDIIRTNTNSYDFNS